MMARREVLSHLIPALVFLILVSIIHWQLKFSLIFFWLGTFLGSFLLDIDHLFYAYVHAPHELTSQRVRRFFEQKRYQEGMILLIETQEERGRMIFHSTLFQIILLVLTFFVLSSSVSLFGKGACLGMLLHSLVDQGSEFIRNGEIDNWFWQFRQKPATSLQAIYLVCLIILFSFFSLFLV